MVEQRNIKASDYKSVDLRTSYLVNWPGSEREVSLLDLRCNEIMEAYFAAREHFAKKGHRDLDRIGEGFFGEELELQCVYRMLLEPGATNPKFRIFKDIDEARKSLEPDERGYFYAWYSNFIQRKASTWKKAPTGWEPDAEEKSSAE